MILAMPAIAIPHITAAQQMAVCVTYANGVTSFCDDNRSYPSPVAGGGAGLSPTPWNTWNDDRLRRWDSEMLRWKGVTAETANQVANLAKQLGVEAATSPQIKKLAAALDSAVASAANSIVAGGARSAASADFWKQIQAASTGLQKLQVVNRSLLLPSLGDDRESFAFPSGVVKGTPQQAFLANAITGNRQFYAATTLVQLNTVQLAAAAGEDAVRANTSLNGQPLATVMDPLSTLTVLLTVQLTMLPENVQGLEVRKQASAVVLPVLDALRGFEAGTRKATTELLAVLANAIRDPTGFAKALARQLCDIPGFARAVVESISKDIKTLIEGTAQERGALLGRYSVDFLTSELGGAAVGKLDIGGKVGLAAMRKGTDSFVTRFVSKYLEGSISSLNSGFGRLKDAFSSQIDILWSHIDSPEIFLTTLQGVQAEIESMMAVDFLADGKPSSKAYQAVLQLANEELSDTEALEFEIRQRLSNKGVIIGLDEARAMVEIAAALRKDDALDRGALQFLDQRYTTAFEIAKREQMGGWEVKNFEGAQIDIVTDSYVVQATTSKFPEQFQIDRFFGRPDKLRQIDRTVRYGKQYNLTPVYYFRDRPPAQVEALLKQRGIQEIWWDLP